MDVTCERCNTAYEFDDALVSDRGTTVKCTNCGHQFRIRRPEAQAQTGGPERWVVRTVDGRELEFRALRELQAAIAQATITREDVLSRGATRPRRLGSIAELDPFFASASQVVPVLSTAHGVGVGLGPRMRVPTPQGLGAMAPQSQRQDGRPDGSVAIPLPIGPRDEDDTTVRPTLNPRKPGTPGQSYRENAATVVARADYPGVVVSSADAPPVGRTQQQRDFTPPPPAVAIQQEADGDELRGTASYGTPRESRSSDARYSDVMQNSQPVMTPTPSNMRNSFTNEDYAEPRFSGPPRRAGVARWIVGFVLSGIVVLGAVTIGRRFLVSSGATTASASGADERVAHFLEGGEKALTEGDLEGAQEQFDKASALAEKDAKVAAAVARIAVVRADVTWLKKKLLAPDDPDFGGAETMQKVDAERARHAADKASELAPNDPSITRIRIDALRESGDAEGARKLVPSITAINGQAETGLTLASLDLGEDKVDFPTVIARLRAAVAAEKDLGRARALLVYALARSGDASGAKTELDRLQALPRPHPLTQALRAFLARSGIVDLSALPEVGKEIPSDWHDALKLAQEAKLKGDKKRVEALLAAAVDKSKGDPEALSASADFKWESGDKTGATDLYKKVIEKAQPSSPWFKHARERLDAKDQQAHEQRSERRANEVDEFTAEAQRRANQAAGIPTAPAPTGTIDTSDLPGAHAPQAPATHDAPPPPPAPTSNAPPGVDTSDLPGFK